MNYKVEFVVCFNAGAWVSYELEVPEKVVNLGTDDVVLYGMAHGIDEFENVCHVGVMNLYTKDDDDSSTLTSYDIGDGDSIS